MEGLEGEWDCEIMDCAAQVPGLLGWKCDFKSDLWLFCCTQLSILKLFDSCSLYCDNLQALFIYLLLHWNSASYQFRLIIEPSKRKYEERQLAEVEILLLVLICGMFIFICKLAKLSLHFGLQSGCWFLFFLRNRIAMPNTWIYFNCYTELSW